MKRIPAAISASYNSSSILISILYFIGLIDWSHDSVKSRHNKRGRPYVYSPIIILRCFIVRIWFRLDSNRSLHHFICLNLSYNRKILRACGLSISYLPPSRRTFDRRLKTISKDIRERILTMENLFVSQDIVMPHILATDSTLMSAKGKFWHVSSMKKDIVRRLGIDLDETWS